MVDQKNWGGFVFVACGAAEYLDTLGLSYKVLQKKTACPVFVVTDNSRNGYPLIYQNLFDIKTPENLDNHQASIWLKTSAHRILPPNKTYVYLDTDILAIGEHVDRIFDEFSAPIQFAPDRGRMPQLGPYALHCRCSEMMKKKSKGIGRFVLLLKHFFPRRYFKISDEFYNKRNKTRMDKGGEAVIHPINMRKIRKKISLRWNLFKYELTSPDGHNIWINSCPHLPETIKKKFDIDVLDSQFQHWNGGVFIFNQESYEFMDTWHTYTLETFKDTGWKTRDQGTLIATVWKLGLQNHPTLDDKWNMILDYYNPELEIDENGEIALDGKEKKKPELVHIFHHWGDHNWSIWEDIVKQLNL